MVLSKFDQCFCSSFEQYLFSHSDWIIIIWYKFNHYLLIKFWSIYSHQNFIYPIKPAFAPYFFFWIKEISYDLNLIIILWQYFLSFIEASLSKAGAELGTAQPQLAVYISEITSCLILELYIDIECYFPDM